MKCLAPSNPDTAGFKVPKLVWAVPCQDSRTAGSCSQERVHLCMCGEKRCRTMVSITDSISQDSLLNFLEQRQRGLGVEQFCSLPQGAGKGHTPSQFQPYRKAQAVCCLASCSWESG